MPPQLCSQLCGCRVWALRLRQEPLPQMDPGTEPLLLLQHKLLKTARPWVAQACVYGASTGMQMSNDCCGFRSETWRWQKKTRVWPPKSRNQSPCKIHGYLKSYGFQLRFLHTYGANIRVPCPLSETDSEIIYSNRCCNLAEHQHWPFCIRWGTQREASVL